MHRLVFEFGDIEEEPAFIRTGADGPDLAALRSYAEQLAGGMSDAFPFRFGAVHVETAARPAGDARQDTPAGTLSAEDQAYWDAYRICWPGASNPGAVAAALARNSAALTSSLRSTQAVRDHPALRAIAAQLALLHGITALGPPEGVYEAVERRVAALGLISPPPGEVQRPAPPAGGGQDRPGPPGPVSGLAVQRITHLAGTGGDGQAAEEYLLAGPDGSTPVRADVLGDGSYRLIPQLAGDHAISDELFIRAVLAIDAHRARAGHAGAWRPLGDREMRLACGSRAGSWTEEYTRGYLARRYGGARRDGPQWSVPVLDWDTASHAATLAGTAGPAALPGREPPGPRRAAGTAAPASRRAQLQPGSPPRSTAR